MPPMKLAHMLKVEKPLANSTAECASVHKSLIAASRCPYFASGCFATGIRQSRTLPSRLAERAKLCLGEIATP